MSKLSISSSDHFEDIKALRDKEKPMTSKAFRSANYKSLFDERSFSNPFMIPADELIFTFKEEESKRRNLRIQSNRQTRIWLKDRPTRAGILKKL